MDLKRSGRLRILDCYDDHGVDYDLRLVVNRGVFEHIVKCLDPMSSRHRVDGRRRASPTGLEKLSRRSRVNSCHGDNYPDTGHGCVRTSAAGDTGNAGDLKCGQDSCCSSIHDSHCSENRVANVVVEEKEGVQPKLKKPYSYNYTSTVDYCRIKCEGDYVNVARFLSILAQDRKAKL